MSEFAEWLRHEATRLAPSDVQGIFDDEPVSLTHFIRDKQFLGNPPLSPVQYEAVRHIERIYYPSLYPLMAKEFEGGTKKDGILTVGSAGAYRYEKYWSQPVRMTNFITLQWGKGSGKDHVARVASMRIAYLLMCLSSPQRYYNMPEQDTIHLLNVASSSGQAQQAFFMPITRAVRSGWFAHRAIPRQNVISFDKNVESISGHSDAESQEGLNLMLGIADEIDAFKSKKESVRGSSNSVREPTKTAEGILNMMRSSGSTRFSETFKNVRISYPRYLGSTIQQLTDNARKDIAAQGLDSPHYVSGPLATWEVNPRVPGKEAFAQEYREDPVMAKAKYECKPSRAINPFFRNKVAIDAAFADNVDAPVEVRYELDEASGRRVWIPRYVFSKAFIPIKGAVYAMHGDLAVSGDRAGIAMAHVVKHVEKEIEVEDEDGAMHLMVETRPYVKADFVISYTSDPSHNPPREIQIRWARQLCFELIRRGFNIRYFSFDAFQSFDSMQILEAKGIETEKVSTNITDEVWRNLRDLVYEGRLIIPRPPVPAGESWLLRDELLSLSKMPNGRVDHPANGSKDEADALACAVLGAIKCGGAEDGKGERAVYTRSEIEVGGMHDTVVRNINRVWESELPSFF